MGLLRRSHQQISARKIWETQQREHLGVACERDAISRPNQGSDSLAALMSLPGGLRLPFSAHGTAIATDVV